MINTIVLDYGGVLAYPITGNWFIPLNFLKIIGFKNMLKLLFKKSRLNGAFNKGNEYLLENHKLFTEEEECEQFTEFYKIVFDELKIKIPADLIRELAGDIVYNDAKVKFYADVEEGIKELKEDYKVIILSDTWPSIKRILSKNGILPLLDGLVISCNYRETKRSVKLFEIAIDECGLIPGECAFIDDSAENLRNAEKAGFRPILMNRENKAEQAEFPAISRLDEIKPLVGLFR